MTDQPDHAPDCKPGVYGDHTAEVPPPPTPPPFDVNGRLRAVLEATRDKVAAARRIDLHRDALDREARRRYAEEHSAPAWNTPQLGKVRLDPKPATAHVRDEDELATYVLGIAPDEVTATIELAGVDLEEALSALEFAGVKVTRSTATVRPAYLKPLLDSLDVLDRYVDPDGDPHTPPVTEVRHVDPDTGAVTVVPGLGVTPASATLVVTLDAALKRETLARVEHDLAEEEPPAVTADLPPALAAAVAATGAVPASQLTAPDPDLTRLEDPTPLDEAAANIGARQREAAAERARLITERHAADTARLAPLTDAESRDAAGEHVVTDDRAQAPADDVEALTAHTLEQAYKSDSLRRACRRATLSATGTKADLAARLHNLGVTAHRMKELTA